MKDNKLLYVSLDDSLTNECSGSELHLRPSGTVQLAEIPYITGLDNLRKWPILFCKA